MSARSGRWTVLPKPRASLTGCAALLLLLLLPRDSAGQHALRAPPAAPAACAVYTAPNRQSDTTGTRREEFARLLVACMARMHAGMAAVDPDADPDRAFAAAMIPHHQGAIDMARLVLLHGRDPRLRYLALKIIAEQQVEIRMLELWLDAPAAAADSTRVPGPRTPPPVEPSHHEPEQ